jgi:hypothetical protein
MERLFLTRGGEAVATLPEAAGYDLCGSTGEETTTT